MDRVTHSPLKPVNMPFALIYLLCNCVIYRAQSGLSGLYMFNLKLVLIRPNNHVEFTVLKVENREKRAVLTTDASLQRVRLHTHWCRRWSSLMRVLSSLHVLSINHLSSYLYNQHYVTIDCNGVSYKQHSWLCCFNISPEDIFCYHLWEEADLGIDLEHGQGN